MNANNRGGRSKAECGQGKEGFIQTPLLWMTPTHQGVAGEGALNSMQGWMRLEHFRYQVIEICSTSHLLQLIHLIKKHQELLTGDE